MTDYLSRSSTLSWTQGGQPKILEDVLKCVIRTEVWESGAKHLMNWGNNVSLTVWRDLKSYIRILEKEIY